MILMLVQGVFQSFTIPILTMPSPFARLYVDRCRESLLQSWNHENSLWYINPEVFDLHIAGLDSLSKSTTRIDLINSNQRTLDLISFQVGLSQPFLREVDEVHIGHH